jgi:serine/threonine-protein kinase
VSRDDGADRADDRQGAPAASPMTPARWRAVDEVVQAALARPAAGRPAFVAWACAGDPALQAEVESLLAAPDVDAGTGAFVARPTIAAALAAAGSAWSAGAAAPDAATPDDAAALAPLAAALAGRYVLERTLGRGGMATVYLARDLRHRRPVAVKVLHRELGAVRAATRFRREIETAARLSHPHILALYDSGAAGGRLYYVMPYVAGQSLRDRLSAAGALPLPEALRVLREVAGALDHAHRHGVVHRDVKPENVLLDEDGHALVADFGIARALQRATDEGGAGGSTETLTQRGVAVGTPAYKAPEQAAADPATDHRADLYALGLIAYEALAGAHPFAGRGPQALLAAHLTEVPAPLAARRPDAPPALTALVMRLLAKEPAGRPQTAGEVLGCLDALPAGRHSDAGPGFRLWNRDAGPRLARRAVAIVGIAAGIGAAAVGASHLLRRPAPAPAPPALDPNRVVVFPLDVGGAGLPDGTGEDVATLLGYALEGTAPLRWLEASNYMSVAQRRDPGRVSAADRQAISRAQRAGFYIDGPVLRHGDSATVILRLHSVAGDSVVTYRGAAGHLATTPVTALGLRAGGELLVWLLAPGRRVDLSPLRDRAPAAIAEFLQGEREYRASRFGPALERYRAALAADSLFALAALNGAQAASWLDRAEDAGQLATLALAQEHALPAHRAAFARGINAYLAGDADSAVAEFKRVLARDPLRGEPWMALGEVYRHLLPRGADLDSLAEAAFARARQIDTTFTPPVYHLAELALSRGALARADTLVRAYHAAHPDSSLDAPLDLTLRCVRSGAGAVDWARAARVATEAVMQAGVLLAGGGAHPGCARAALWAALNSSGASAALRWSALVALQGLLVATGREADVVRLLQSPVAAGLDADALLLLDATAGAAGGPVQARAAAVAAELGGAYPAMRPYTLWALGTWEAEHGPNGRAERVRAIASTLAAKADSSGARSDALRAGAIAARSALVSGDTGLAIRRLRQLVPSAPRRELLWYPWEGLGGERLLLATLLLARRDAAGAESAASPLAGSHPIAYLVYLRPSLLVRARAADARGDGRAATRLRARLAALERDTAALPWPVRSSPNR